MLKDRLWRQSCPAMLNHAKPCAVLNCKQQPLLKVLFVLQEPAQHAQSNAAIAGLALGSSKAQQGSQQQAPDARPCSQVR